MARAHRFIVAAVLASVTIVPAAAADDGTGSAGFWDRVLEKLDVKAKPADPAPDFVRKTRPDVSSLEYMQRSLPHGVSAEPVKTPDQVQAAKDALDAARARQLQPGPGPVQLVKPKPGKPKPAAAN